MCLEMSLPAPAAGLGKRPPGACAPARGQQWARPEPALPVALPGVLAAVIYEEESLMDLDIGRVCVV